MPDKIFLDCGGHNGCSMRYFRKVFDPINEYYAFTFEPDPQFKKCYKGMRRHCLIPMAVWVRDGSVNVYRTDNDASGWHNTVLNQHKLHKPGTGFFVSECVDISKWITENLHKDDYIVMKLSVEGAEYMILEKLIRTGAIEYINHLYVKWNWKDVKGMKIAQHRAIAKKITGPAVYTEWNAHRFIDPAGMKVEQTTITTYAHMLRNKKRKERQLQDD